MDDLIINVPVIGDRADQALKEATQGQVIGAPSSGVFLRTESDRILFLSLMAWHGPLTINLSSADRQALPIDLHDLFQIQSGSIYFPDSRISFQFSQAERWLPPSRPDSRLTLFERKQHFERVAGRVRSRQDRALQLNGELNSTASPEPAALRAAISTSQVTRLIEALVAGLGRGPGLTPAGDDLALGFLLALNRWGDLLCPDLVPQPFNQALVETACLQTTALSANLIECAAAGQADERLVAALDGLVSGNLAEDRIVEYLLDWGHTSGASAMVGMGLIISLGEESIV
jgi:hypothetical protein